MLEKLDLGISSGFIEEIDFKELVVFLPYMDKLISFSLMGNLASCKGHLQVVQVLVEREAQ